MSFKSGLTTKEKMKFILEGRTLINPYGVMVQMKSDGELRFKDSLNTLWYMKEVDFQDPWELYNKKKTVTYYRYYYKEIKNQIIFSTHWTSLSFNEHKEELGRVNLIKTEEKEFEIDE